MENPDRSATRAPDQLVGKTYSLRLRESTSDRYYELIGSLTDKCLQQVPDARTFLAKLQELSSHRRTLHKISEKRIDSEDGRLLDLLSHELAEYTSGVRAHLRERKGFRRWGGSLSTTEAQYHLYMLEIEITNRLNISRFKLSDAKLAFLPHCLRDLDADCRSAQRDLDYVCKGCTDGCNVNLTSKLLRRHGVKPYIWMNANLRAIFRRARKEGNSLGVLGIACVPELVRGMKMCSKGGVPVVGIPLDANRCARWWGQIRWNGVNLKQLETLLSSVHSV